MAQDLPPYLQKKRDQNNLKTPAIKPAVIFFGMDYFEETGIYPTDGYPDDFAKVLQAKYERESRQEKEKKEEEKKSQ